MILKFLIQKRSQHLNILPELIPCQMQILQELLDVQVKAPSPSQTAKRKQLLVQLECLYHLKFMSMMQRTKNHIILPRKIREGE